MGQWSVVSVTGRNQPLDDATSFGTNWYVTYRIKYTPSTFGPFVEPPKMAWDEVILYADYAKGEYWDFSGNFYVQKPDSPTMAVWAQRYFRAYLNAHNMPFTGSFGQAKGHSKLFDKNGVAVPGSALGTYGNMDGQNKAVQKYLKNNGGILEIEVHDVPAILKPTTASAGKSVERVLIFNCGVEGAGQRAKGWQHIKIDSSQPKTSWTYNFQTAGSAPGIRTTGLKKIPDPTPKGSLLPSGGIW